MEFIIITALFFYGPPLVHAIRSAILRRRALYRT